jgi:hypothetical protein
VNALIARGVEQAIQEGFRRAVVNALIPRYLEQPLQEGFRTRVRL